MALQRYCWPLHAAVKHAARHTKVAVAVRHRRRVRRAIVWACVALGGTTAAVIPPLLWAPAATPQTAFAAPPDWFPAPPQPAGPETQPEQPTPPEQPSQPVAEPRSLALLATALAAMWGARP